MSVIDSNTPEWTLTSGRFASVRVGDGASCSDGRAATLALALRLDWEPRSVH